MKPALTKTELVTGPATLPVTTDQLRLQLWTIYPEKTTEEYLEMLIEAATLHVESITWRKLISQKWRLYLDSWPDDGILLPFGSIRSVDLVRWLDADGDDHELATSTDYIPAIVGPEPMVMPVSSGWPTGTLFDVDPIRVEFTAGFGDAADVPANIRHAIQLLAAHWYEQREAVIVGTTVRNVPLTFDALINPWKIRFM